MTKGKVVNSWEVKPFVCDNTYSSKMLLDDIVAGAKAIHMNEGTLKAGCKTAGLEVSYLFQRVSFIH